RRTFRSAVAFEDAGDFARTRSMLEGLASEIGPGLDRSEVLRRMAESIVEMDGWATALPVVRQVAAESGDDPRVRQWTGQVEAFTRMYLGDLPRAMRLATAALAGAERLGAPVAIVGALSFLCYLQFLMGRGLREDEFERARVLEAQGTSPRIVLRSSFTLAQ